MVWAIIPLWWWLPLRLSKRQSTPTTVLLRTTLQTRTITQTTTLTHLGSNLLLLYVIILLLLYNIYKSRRVGRRGGGVRRVRSHPPPPLTGRNSPPGKNLFRWKMWTCAWKNAKDEPFSSDLSLYPIVFSAVDHLELCSYYWFICRDPLTVVFDN